MAEGPISEDRLALEIAQSERRERETSDSRYAPMVVKTILYGFIGTIALGITLGMADLVSKTFLKRFEPPAVLPDSAPVVGTPAVEDHE